MAISFVQQTTASDSGASASFPSPVTAGNVIVVSGGISAVSDNVGNTYLLAVNHTNYVGVSIYYAYNVNGGSVTVSPTLAGNGDWVAEEWTGFGTADPLGGTGGAHGPGVTPVTATPTASAAGCAVVTVSCANIGFVSSASGTNPSAFTTRMNFGSFSGFTASGTHTAGTVEATINYGGGTNADAAIAYFVDNGDELPDVTGSGGVSIGAPALSGTGSFTPATVTGSGGVVIGAPSLTSGYTHLTQMARQVGTAEDNPETRLTQFARQVGTAESNPQVRLTQMARQVMYSYTCAPEDETEPPPITDGPIVHVIIRPQWELERLDVKIRPEERGAKR